jgi:hypothetical protein
MWSCSIYRSKNQAQREPGLCNKVEHGGQWQSQDPKPSTGRTMLKISPLPVNLYPQKICPSSGNSSIYLQASTMKYRFTPFPAPQWHPRQITSAFWSLDENQVTSQPGQIKTFPLDQSLDQTLHERYTSSQ